MCQIIVSNKFELSQRLLLSLYRANSDGVGFAGGGQPVKLLPKKFHDVWDFYQQHIHGRAGAVHFRMRTDGDISLSRVHPYTIIPGKLWLMHNGILSGYRSKLNDPESDTQKYVAQVLAPLLRRSPTLWKRLEFQMLVEEHIGKNNRFVFVDKHGETAILNRRTGYEVGNDWYANGYSFDASDFFPSVFGAPMKRSTGGYSGHYSSVPGIGWETDDTWESYNVRQMAGRKDYRGEFGASKYPAAVPTTAPVPMTPWKTGNTPAPVEDDPLPMVSDPESLAIALGFAPDSYPMGCMKEALTTLRQVDSQEYHGIRQEVLNLYKRVKDEQELDRLLDDLVNTVWDTLDSYGLITLATDDETAMAAAEEGAVVAQVVEEAKED